MNGHRTRSVVRALGATDLPLTNAVSDDRQATANAGGDPTSGTSIGSRRFDRGRPLDPELESDRFSDEIGLAPPI